MITVLTAIALALVTGWLIEAVAGGAIDRAISAFRELIGGWRPDGWPRGVQEEDRDRPWGSGTSSISQPLFQRLIEPAAQAVATVQVSGRTRPR